MSIIRGFSACIYILPTLWMGMDSYAGVFYCGTIEFAYDEKASVQYENYPEAGGHTKINEFMIFQYGGR
jgi:hypothetical protein